MAKHVFVTGGVASSVGKGLTAASIGRLLEQRGLRVRMQKLDPYLNVDPGTMNPHQHGEVYVLNDGSETDLDLGHYERLTSGSLDGRSAVTAGQIYQRVIERERRGDYLGQTVQMIPHVTDTIQAHIAVFDHEADVVVTEIGGTVGDIEAMVFLEAIRQFKQKHPADCLFVHVSLVPEIAATGECKTKPTQHSVAALRQVGIQPDVLICRAARLPEDDRHKLSMFCGVPLDSVIWLPDARDTVYEVPLMLRAKRLDSLIASTLKLPEATVAADPLGEYVDAVRCGRRAVVVALVGKYTGNKDSYKSVIEALMHAGVAAGCSVKVVMFDSSSVKSADEPVDFHWASGILVPGGFGERGVAGMMAAARHARRKRKPYFGICLGMQVAVIDFARDVLGVADATSMEFGDGTPLFCLLDKTGRRMDVGGTLRRGASDVCFFAQRNGCIARAAYGHAAETPVVSMPERHRHRYELNPEWTERLNQGGMAVVAKSDKGVAEIVELSLPGEHDLHPWFVGVQFHPEFRSRPGQPHPLFLSFIQAAMATRLGSDLTSTAKRGIIPQ